MIQSTRLFQPAFQLVVALGALAAVSLASAQPLSRIAFGSCAAEDEPQPIWESVNAGNPDLWIWAGDNIYGDTDDMAVMREKYSLLAAQPGYRQLVSSGIPILATWDDHDFGANDGGTDYPHKKASQRVFLDFFGVADDDPRRDREGVYHAEIHGEAGQRVQIIMLDTRYHRSPLRAYPRDDDSQPRVYWPDSDPAATILGEEQWQWLKRQLLKPAELRLIVSSIQVLASEHRFEKWMNFPQERRRLLDLLKDTQAEGVILLSGDRHHAELSRLDQPDFYPLFDLTSSGLNKSRPRPTGAEALSPEPNRYRVGRIFRGHHYGMVEVDWDQPDPLIHLNIIDQQGQKPIRQVLPLSSLSLKRNPAPGLRSESSGSVLPEAIETDLTVDGKIDDWPGTHFMAVSGEHLFIRFPALEPTTLTRSPRAIHIAIDFDGDQTGIDHFLEPGTDMEIVFSPPRAPGERGWRPSITGYLPDETILVAADMDLASGPSHASSWFELRLSRAKLAEVLSASGTGGEAGLAVYARDKESDRIEVLASDAVALPDVRGIAPATSRTASIPPPLDGALRVISWNTLWGSQLETPEPFARVIQALNPDILLFQEWSRDRLTEKQITDWFGKHIDGDVAWHSMVSGAAGSWSGTLIVSRYPLMGRIPRTTPVDAGGWDFPARFAAAVADTPIGDVLVGSLHLKASGAIDTPEDQRRFAEADAINRILVGMKSVARPDHVILGGDFNLLGDPAVVDRVGRMLDQDGSPLTRIEAPVLGDPALLYTFGREGLRSRLDYLTYSDHSLQLARAFVLDTGILEQSALNALQLDSADSAASDHLPVVVDLIPWPE
ncbi:MAG: alkaline phosphatase D family protein [Wenzhouxiangella sp.]